MKPHYIFIVSYPCYCYVVLQFQTVAGSHSDTNANSGGVDGRTSGQAQRPAAVLPVYMTQDRLTLAVLTLLLGGWLAFALTYPAVSMCVCVCSHVFKMCILVTRFYSQRCEQMVASCVHLQESIRGDMMKYILRPSPLLILHPV